MLVLSLVYGWFWVCIVVVGLLFIAAAICLWCLRCFGLRLLCGLYACCLFFGGV